MPNKMNGFTLVELLIVIIVIAVLASVSVIAYNGIQDRAENAKTVNAVESYIKALSMYKIDNGSYPITGGMCLGDNYPAFAGVEPACRYSNSRILQSVGAGARNQLKKYLGEGLPMPSTKPIRYTTTVDTVGAWFYGTAYGYTVNSEPHIMVQYSVTSSTCPVGPVYKHSGGGVYTPATDGRSSAISGGSTCFVMLPVN